MLISPPDPEIQLFQKLTLKIESQGHEWGQSSKSQCESNILLTHIPAFGFMSIGPPIPDIQPFQNLTLKIQGQGHSSRSQSRYDTLSTRIPFAPCRSALPFLGYSYFKILMLKIQGQGHGWHGWSQSLKSQLRSNILSTHITFVPCQSGIPFLSYDFFKFWHWKSRVKVMGDSSKSQCGSNILLTHIPFVPCQSALPFPRYSILKIWPWKSWVKVKWPWCCITTGLDNSIELQMV